MRSKIWLIQALALALGLVVSAGIARADAGCTASSTPLPGVPENARCSFTTGPSQTLHFGGTGTWKIDATTAKLDSKIDAEVSRLGGQRFGTSIACVPASAGQAARVIVGAPGLGGSVSRLTGKLTVKGTLTVGGAVAEGFGSSVATGDLDGDGFAEIAVGAPGGGNGAVFVFDGASADLALVLAGNEPGDFGARVAIGDVNRDGLPDLVASAPSVREGAGMVEAFRYPSGERIFALGGQAPGEAVGTALAITPNVAAGESTLHVGAPGAAGGRGAVDFVGAQPAGGVFRSRVEGPDGARGYGTALATGDLDGDGFPDVVVGMPDGADGGGEVAVIDGYGRYHRWLWRDSSGRAARTGATVAAGDVNGDGILEVVAGAPGDDDVLVFSNTGRLVEPDGPPSARGFGSALDLCDLDGDGIDELVVGSPLADGDDDENGRPTKGAGMVESRGALRMTFENATGPSKGDFAAPVNTVVAVSALGGAAGTNEPSFVAVWTTEPSAVLTIVGDPN